MRKIAIIGTRTPNGYQLDDCQKFIDTLHTSDIVASGCAYGVDAFALKYANSVGLTTIGYVPWKDYNMDVQEYCTKVVVFNSDIYTEACESVNQFHPAPNKLSQGAFKLHARNYLIIDTANFVLAYPGPTGGGTMQGIKVAQSKGIPVAINPHLVKDIS